MWRKPKRPLNYELKMEELKTLGTFGLKTKRELWKAHTELSRIRHQARSLLALGQEIREEKEPILMKSLKRIGLVGESSTLDDVLNLHVEELLGRRLQTIVMKKLGFKTPYQARQAVIHGHIVIGDRVVNVPSYIVTVNEEKDIKLTPGSSLKELLEKISKNDSSEKTVSEKTDDESSDIADKNVESASDEGKNDSTDKPEE